MPPRAKSSCQVAQVKALQVLSPEVTQLKRLIHQVEHGSSAAES
ncbi:hypothetical protein ABZ924_21850 [Streptomyces sp. NPDC046876]